MKRKKLQKWKKRKSCWPTSKKVPERSTISSGTSQAGKLLADIKKGAREINDFFWDLTGGEWQINCFLTPIGDANNEFSAAVQMAAWDGLLDLCIYNTPDERETTIRVSHRGTVADAQAIRNQCSSYYSEWIFAHGDEVCDMIMDRLEEEYEKRASCQ